ncbi:Txe/YoeB family addiction module toxin [Caenimonas aquaedulcis]|uniref:Putative mRNA interferase YoeB n=1 Tax=Caenimonas aquaedulcis TaxID=2793270 RepID=A0A931H1K6_9BURK|nr:Txe/YoeB family addiction module toxin [Caenimonas aquaedulcis]MBG9386891.1 Txe/YoeB family addiction module toxin [Caenimonas aquaedulcis]
MPALQIAFSKTGWKQFQELMALDRKLFTRAMDLIDVAARDPFGGIGKPEPLKHQLAGCWSRRINERHRLVYRVDGNDLVVLACLYHYGDDH